MVPAFGNLQRIVHIELNGVGCHVEPFDFFGLERDVTIDHVISEYAAGCQELTIRIECFYGHAQARGNGGD